MTTYLIANIGFDTAEKDVEPRPENSIAASSKSVTGARNTARAKKSNPHDDAEPGERRIAGCEGGGEVEGTVKKIALPSPNMFWSANWFLV